jgi:predicted metalloendopeptidase
VRARWRGALVAAALVAALVVGCASRPAAPTAGIDRTAIDAGVRPQDDFFRHVNGTWLKTATIPPERSRIGGFVALRERTEGELLAIIEDAVKGPRDDDERRIAALYRSFMDEGAAERAGLAPLAGELAAIDQVATGDDVAAAIGRLDRLGARAPLALAIALDARDATRWLPTIGQSGLLLPDRDYYLVADEPRFVAARAACVAYLARLLALAGASDAAQQAEAVFALETALAGAQWTRVAARDPVRTYNKVRVDALAGVDPRFAWPPFLAATGVAGRIDEVVVREPSYVTALAAAIAATPIPVWKAYLRTRLLDAYAPYLGNDFVAARFAFAGTALSGTPENLARWRRGVALVQQSLGDALGKLYVARHHPARSQQKMEVLVDNLFAAYRESIGSLDWMSEATRRERRGAAGRGRVRARDRARGRAVDARRGARPGPHVQQGPGRCARRRRRALRMAASPRTARASGRSTG